MKPKDITKDIDTGIEIASFDYYSGIIYAKDNNLGQTTNFKDVTNGTHFIVCCGDVMVLVKDTDFTDINRRVI